MKKILFLFFVALAFAACKKESNQIKAPSTISDLDVQPTVGGAILSWAVPADSNYTYLEVSYMKNGKKITTNVSKYTNSIEITGLLNKLDYTFEVRPVNNNGEAIAYSDILTTSSVKPIRRPIQTAYIKLAITNALIDTYTQETSEGPKSNLVDGTITSSNYWHSAWSDGVAPLPHWIKLSLPVATDFTRFSYVFRQNTTISGRPTQIALETSTDGITWTRVWTSPAGLSVGTASVISAENILTFDQTYNSKYFRVMFLATQGNTTFVTLSEVSFYRAQLTDLELEAEKTY
ncbi:DUF4959 domain-containing protein [Pedobacter arcticus]|uniref:DUF4959 domain-containing protein n=1 Tax=Pedobacter arcticus TaxID=752140 RepID=UPI0002D50ADF|nr:DUF4959 domain-containing protein [Pedobacter arcticus]